MAQQALRNLPPPWDRLIPLFTRLFVWGLLFGILYILRSFFLLIFLTFVFGYIQSHSVDRLGKYIRGRTTRVVTVAVGILTALILIGLFLSPRVREQAQVFANQYSRYVQVLDTEIVKLSKSYPVLERVSPDIIQLQENPQNWTMQHSPTAHIAQEVLGLGEGQAGAEGMKEMIVALTNIGGKILAIGSAFLLSLLFSFLIVLDLPRLTENVKSLKHTSLRFIYDEVADDIYQFGSVLGRALEAQLFIALLNTVLTALGLYILGLHSKVAFLSTIVFLCSFVPVAGVFASSIPICLLALQQSGVQLMLFSIFLIIAIHMVETYILNPKIYGHHMHMNPVLVLGILTIGGKLFGVWGLVLGVPLCTYFFGHYIQRR